jgi:hypothetical protein
MTFWVAGAAIGGAVISSSIGSSAAKSAANTQAASADRAAALQNEQFNQTRNDQAPYRDAGGLYLNKLMHLLGQSPTVDSSSDPNFGLLSQKFDMGKFAQDPGYQFRLDQGNQALTRAAAASGTMGSGKFLKDAMAYNQGQASQEYGNAYNRYNMDNDKLFNRYASLAGIGQTATNQLQQAGQNYATNAGNSIMAGGNARASGYVGSANALSGGIGQAINGYQQNQLMNRLFPASGTPSVTYGSGFGTGSSFGNQDYGQYL